MVVLVASGQSVSIDLIVYNEFVVLRIGIGGRVDIFQNVSVRISGAADLCEVAQLGVIGERSGKL